MTALSARTRPGFDPRFSRITKNATEPGVYVLVWRDWVEDGEGNKLFWPVYGYGDEGPREQTWYVEGVVKHHRKVSTLVNGLVAAGLTIEHLEEPPEVVPPDNRPVFPENRQRPSVLILSSTKAVTEGI